LEEALIAFEGAILLVSHDRYFLDRVVNRLLVLPERARYELIPGNWSTYEQRLTEAEAKRRTELEAARRQARRGAGARSKRTPAATTSEPDSPYTLWTLERIEEAIIEYEDQLDEIEQQFANPSVYRDADRARSLRAQANALRTQLADLNRVWEARVEEEYE